MYEFEKAQPVKPPSRHVTANQPDVRPLLGLQRAELLRLQRIAGNQATAALVTNVRHLDSCSDVAADSKVPVAVQRLKMLSDGTKVSDTDTAFVNPGGNLAVRKDALTDGSVNLGALQGIAVGPGSSTWNRPGSAPTTPNSPMPSPHPLRTPPTSRRMGVDPITMSDDPFMPAARRFPRDSWPPVGSDEPPSGIRPFVLQGARQVPPVVTGKHRTAPHQTPHTDETTNDGTKVPDTWHEQDD